MKRFIFPFVFAAAFFSFALSTSAQRNVEQAIERDPILELDAKHNLDVANQAFGPGKKAYKQVLGRFEETYAAYPDFSRMDEFLYIAGMSSVYLSENKGKQKVNLKSQKEREKYAPERLRENAVAYFNVIVDRYPKSEYAEKAKEMLKQLLDGPE